MSEITLKSVRDLMDKNFLIPSYQRGYRWSDQQVTDLLKDIYDFTKKRHNSKEFYCLQPVVVKKMTAQDLTKHKLEGEWYEVIDGQQRLTTIKIILRYLVLDYLSGKSLKQEYGKDEFNLKYETRKESEHFFAELNLNTQIVDSNIDYYHITNALSVVRNWFKQQEKPRSAKEKILHTFVYDEDDRDNPDGTVQIIWYETQEKSPTTVFKRLNSGKIPLTNAELIKALFLNSSNFSDNGENAEKANFLKSRIYLRQLEIANAWDRIEYTLHDDTFWLFLHSDSYSNPTRIDFIFDLIKENDYLNIKETCFNNDTEKYAKELGTDSYQAFRYFERFLATSDLKAKEKRLDECWGLIKSIFNVFAEWYNDIELYHYIGYLICFDSNAVSSIYKEWMEKETRDAFLKELKRRIKEKIKKCENLNQQYSYNAEEDGRSNPNKTVARPILLLHNIQTVINQNKDFENKSDYGLGFYYKFPFHLYKKESWNIEHIFPETENSLENEEEQREWLQSVYNSKIENNFKDEIKSFLTDSSSEADDERNKHFRELYNRYYSNISDKYQLLSEKERNRLWNFVLLDEHTNKGYGNAIFSVKRRFIIGKEQGEKLCYNPDSFEIEPYGEKKPDVKPFLAFVPVCTKNVFMKFYTPYPNDLTEWTKEDAQNYLEDIKNTLKDFDIKEKQNEQ